MIVIKFVAVILGCSVFGLVVGFISGKRVALGLLGTTAVVIATYFVLAFRDGIFSTEERWTMNLMEMLEQAAPLLFLWVIPSFIGFECGQRCRKRRTLRG